MLTELFVTNLASTVVTHGGMSAPPSGTLETFTVSESDGTFPVVRRNSEQFHFKDRDPHYGSEILACIETDEDHWTVIRGAENSQPVIHGRRFSIRQVITSEFLQRLGSGSTTDLVNAVTVCGADPIGETSSSTALTDALRLGPTYLPSGIYRLDQTINLLPGAKLLSFGDAVLRPSSTFSGLAAVELIDGTGSTRIDNVTLDGSDLGAGTDIYGVFAETRRLEADLRDLRISHFPNSGAILSGRGWTLTRTACSRNYGSGFEIDLSASLLFGCRAIDNHRFGFVGAYDEKLMIGCLASGNRSGDYRTPSG